jgi:hypothetical protein
MDRRKRRSSKIHRDYRGTPTLASRQFDVRDELFFVAFFHYCSCSTLISPPADFGNVVGFCCEAGWCSHQLLTYVVAVMYVRRYCTQVVFPSGRCPVTSTCGQFDSRSIYGPLHRSLMVPVSALNTCGAPQ